MHLLQLKILNVTKDISIAEGIQRLDFYIYIAIGYVKMGQSLENNLTMTQAKHSYLFTAPRCALPKRMENIT